MRIPGPFAGAMLLVAALFVTPATIVFAQGDVTAELRREDFFKEGLAPVRKPASYDLTVVYFMDYQCPSCRKYAPDVERALREEKRVRVIYRDTPIFGPRSEAAARAAIASSFQGRHEAMHHALMTEPLPLDDAAIRRAADKAHVDWGRLQRDLRERANDITSVIDWNQHLSVEGGISGTPAFIIGNRLADGALEYADLRASIADARREAVVADPASPAKVAETAAVENGTAAEPAKATSDEDAELKSVPASDASEPSAKAQAGTASTSGAHTPLAIAALALLIGATALLWRRQRGKAL